MANNKAFICFCVDGQSDVDALRDQFEDLFDEIGGNDINVDFRCAEANGENQGDITTLKGVDPDNIEQMMYKYYFKDQDKSSDLGWDDLTCIIHIIDLDGAYVKDECIREFTDEESVLADKLVTSGKSKLTLYMDDHIAVRPENDPTKPPAVLKMCDRNKRKRKNIEYLLSLDGEFTAKRTTVKYMLYYFSSNLDHYLYGDANLTGVQKMRQASEFSDKYGDAESLSEFFNDSEFSTCLDYEGSWRSLRKGKNSLSRGTNLNLLIETIKESELEDWL